MSSLVLCNQSITAIMIKICLCILLYKCCMISSAIESQSCCWSLWVCLLLSFTQICSTNNKSEIDRGISSNFLFLFTPWREQLQLHDDQVYFQNDLQGPPELILQDSLKIWWLCNFRFLQSFLLLKSWTTSVEFLIVEAPTWLTWLKGSQSV